MPDMSPSSDPTSVMLDNMSQAVSAMQGPDTTDDKKKDEKDPTLQLADQLSGFVEQLSGMATEMYGCSDTDFSPMSMLEKGMDFLNSYDSDAKENNKSSSPNLGKDAVNTEELETVATLAL